MSEEIEFTFESGKHDEKDLTVYALSTCGFCKRGLKFLRDNQLAFKWVYVDKIPFEVKQRCKAELADKFKRRVYFPFLVVDDEDCLVGFTESQWREKLELDKLEADKTGKAIKQKTPADAKLFMEMVAKKQGWVVNPDPELIGWLSEGLSTNWNRYGYFSCPCRDADGVKERDKDIICPCDYCVPDQEEFGHCYCGLYLTREFADSGKKPHSIPERRPE
ncbi:MAG: ferredoxin-thioredoxin reductase catalytic domain-containing protein [Promethearchaeota archaeon]